MKKSIFVLALLLGSTLGHAQKLREADVPANVKQAFAQKFPNAKEVKWSKESANEFEAAFEDGAREQSANFDPAGQWLGTETEIKVSELPQPVQALINKDFAGFKIKEAEKAEAPGKDMFYEVELAKGKAKYEVQISADGKLIKKEEMTK